jgi:CRP/FNR family cyclic AMP-dependent transcriptional regulator
MTPYANDGTNKSERFDYSAFIAKYAGTTIANYGAEKLVYAQGDTADAVFYVISGTVKVTVVSEHGKEAVLALLGNGDFFGEECLESHSQRNSTVTTAATSDIVRIDYNTIARALGDDVVFAKMFLSYVLDQNEKLRDDLVDQLFNSSEKRLARILLTLAHFGMNKQSNTVAIPITQETLANMVGTTRSRINQFMTKFRKLGYIEYDDNIRVNNSLLNVILDDPARREAC